MRRMHAEAVEWTDRRAGDTTEAVETADVRAGEVRPAASAGPRRVTGSFTKPSDEPAGLSCDLDTAGEVHIGYAAIKVTNGERRVLARGMSANHSPSRKKLSATAVST
jgi:hypothetical protein